MTGPPHRDGPQAPLSPLSPAFKGSPTQALSTVREEMRVWR